MRFKFLIFFNLFWASFIAVEAQTFSNATNYAIPDNNTATGASSIIAVSGLGTSLNCSSFGLQSVCIGITHTWDSDLDVYLVAPDGTTIELTTDNGGSGDNYGNGTSNDSGPFTCFSMTAGTAVTAGTAPFNGTYVPEGNIGSANNGQNPNGNWTLRVYDDAAGDVGTLFYWQLTFANSSLPCPSLNMSGTATTTCGVTYYDNGGTGNYTNNQNITQTICSSTAGQCVSVSFSSFSLENGYDYLYIYNGNSTLAPQFAGSPYTGTAIPGPFTATTNNTSGCITFQFISDGIGTSSGWVSSISCTSCASPPATVSQDCVGSTQVCSNNNFAGNNSGSGNIGELNPTNRGCLFEENNSSWYHINVGASGTLTFVITPSNGSDDYDYAIWGPTTACSPTSAPIRCNYAAYPRAFGCGTNTNPTGLNTTSTNTSAAACDDRPYLQQLSVNAGEVYILLIDGYTASSQQFNLSWGGTASISCTPISLPIELISFSGKKEGSRNLLEWTTAVEINNSFFTIEKSFDGFNFTELQRVQGAGMSTSTIHYNLYDEHPYNQITYYRLKQTDNDGRTETFSTISITGCAENCIEANAYYYENHIIANINETAGVSYTVKIFDIVGNELKKEAIYTQKGNNSLIFDGSLLSSGIYFVTFENNKNILTQKLLIKK